MLRLQLRYAGPSPPFSAGLQAYPVPGLAAAMARLRVQLRHWVRVARSLLVQAQLQRHPWFLEWQHHSVSPSSSLAEYGGSFEPLPGHRQVHSDSGNIAA